MLQIRKKTNSLTATIVALCCLFSFSASAQTMPQFLYTFSGYCYQNMANFEGLKPLLEFEDWEEIGDDLLDLLGRPANPNAVVEGYRKIVSSDRGYVLGLTTIPGSRYKVCTLASLGADDYDSNIDALKKYFDVKQVQQNRQGIVLTEVWKIKHPLFERMVLMTQKLTQEAEGNDLGQFHLGNID